MSERPRDLVIPSSLRFYTDLVPRLIASNPGLAQQVINCLNVIDRSRNYRWRQVLGDVKVNHG